MEIEKSKARDLPDAVSLKFQLLNRWHLIYLFRSFSYFYLLQANNAHGTHGSVVT